MLVSIRSLTITNRLHQQRTQLQAPLEQGITYSLTQLESIVCCASAPKCNAAAAVAWKTDRHRCAKILVKAISISTLPPVHRHISIALGFARKPKPFPLLQTRHAGPSSSRRRRGRHERVANPNGNNWPALDHGHLVATKPWKCSN